MTTNGLRHDPNDRRKRPRGSKNLSYTPLSADEQALPGLPQQQQLPDDSQLPNGHPVGQGGPLNDPLVVHPTVTDTDGTDNPDNNSHYPPHPHSTTNRCWGYWRVVQVYPKFRYYLLLDLSKNAGEWLARVAALIVIQEWSGTGEALSYLALATLLPKAVCAPLGGSLADGHDRRHVMMILDGMGGITIALYLVVVYTQSLWGFYAVTAFRSALISIYYPVYKGILPLLVTDVQDLQYAVTMTSWTWASMAIVGGLVAGSIEAILGTYSCFALDSLFCWFSVLVMWLGVKGEYNVSKNQSSSTQSTSNDNPRAGSLLYYLTTCGFGFLVALKGTGSIILGPEDIVGVEFATVRNADGSEDEQTSSLRVGLLFALIGFGNLMGPTVMNFFTDAHRPSTLQRACWLSCIVQALGWALIAVSPNFAWFLVFTVIRTLGAGMIYTYSSLLLQSLSDKEMLGRMLSVEYTIYVLAHAFSASISGYLLDAGVSEEGLSWFGASMAALATGGLGAYHFLGMGAANERFNRKTGNDENGELYLEQVPVTENQEVELQTRNAAKDDANAEIV